MDQQVQTPQGQQVRGGEWLSGAYHGFELMPIAGRWREGQAARSMDDVDPFRGDTILSIPLANAADLDEAYRAAANAQKSWAKAKPQVRRDVLEKAAAIMEARHAEIVDWLIREAGSTRIKAEIEWELVHSGMLEAATYPFRATGQILPTTVEDKESFVYREPVGVVGVISPWNFPLQLSNRSVAPALALGNAVVLKPASDTPITGGLLLAKIFEEAGLPEGLLSVVVGAGRDIGDAFIEHPVPRVISFTGSTPVGRHIAEIAGRTLKRVCLELGGNGPFVVLHDADLDVAVRAAVFGKFLHQGQICMAVNRIIVHEDLHDAFVEAFCNRVNGLKAGNPAEPDTAIGPIINQAQLASIQDKVHRTLEAGGSMSLGGRIEGLVLHPIVLTEVTNDMPAAKEELFGPVAPILKAHSDEDAIAIANDTESGLSSAVCTRDLARGIQLARSIEAGMTHVNDTPEYDEANSPFGGEKASGLGRFGGRWAIDEFTTEHWISVQHSPRKYPF